jgi:hypothetical protein
MAKLTKEGILAEAEALLRIAPTAENFREANATNFAYWGRLLAVNNKLEYSLKKHDLESRIDETESSRGDSLAQKAFFDIMIWLHQVNNQLRMETIGPINTAIGHGMVFDYFDEIKNLIQSATADILFIDPYLNEEFVQLYLPFVQSGTLIRLLARAKMATLLPAAKLFAQQTNRQIEVRSAPNFHDRYIIIDGANCYQSGASFKDGGKTAPTTITQITDAFAAVRETYEDLWSNATVQL